MALVVPLVSPGAALAQEEKPAPKREAAEEPEKPEKPVKPVKPDKKVDLTPVDIGGPELVTKDGVQLKATFYPSAKGKEAVPVILLHMSKGDRKEYNTLAPFLQEQGHAVLVPDLRGHGESTSTLAGGKLDPGNIDLEQMVYQDMETLRRFLLQKNNEGELNISKLCVVGAEMGALVALNWARYDWTSLTGERPPMHVKALVLISPPPSFPGLTTKQALANLGVRSQLSVLIVVGKEVGKYAEEAKRIHNIFKRYHPEPPKEQNLTKEQKLNLQDLFYGPLETKLQGSKMLGVRGLNVDRAIAQFIDLRLVKQNRPELAWRDRSGKGK